MLSLKEAIRIANEKNPHMEVVSAIEYEKAFTFALVLKSSNQYILNSSTFVVMKDGSKAGWMSIFDVHKIFKFAALNIYERNDIKKLMN